VRALVRHAPLVLLGVAVVVYAVYFAHLTLVRYWAFEARALDLGNFHQTVWNTWQGRPFHLTNQSGVVNRLSLHVEPILLPISQLYWLHDGPETLLVLQAVVVALGALPLFALARHTLRPYTAQHVWLALLFALAFLLNPSMQAANWLEFHAVTLAPTFLLAAFYFLVTNRTGLFSLFAILTASCKEEMALLVFMLGLYAWVALRKRRLGLLVMALSGTWALTAVLVIQNHFAAGNIHWDRYAYLGDTPLQMIGTLLTRPDLVLAQLRTADALRYGAQLLFPLGFLALLAPEVLLLALPSLAINLLADFPPMHQVDTLIYAAPIVPFVLIASVTGVARLLRLSRTTHHALPRRNATVAAIALLLVTCTVIAQRLYGYTPWGGNHLPLHVTPHHRRAATIIEQIPPAARVSAQDRLNPHVAGRETVYIFPRMDDADTVFLDVTGPAWPQHPGDLRRSVDDLLAQGFSVTAATDGYLLLRRDADGAPSWPDAFYAAWRVPNFAPENPHAVDFGDVLRLRDVRVQTDRYGELVVQLYWTLLQPMPRDRQFYIAYLDAAGNVLHDTEFYPPVVTLWYPTSSWAAGGPADDPANEATGDAETAFLVQTLPWSLETDRFVLALGLHRADGRSWQTGQRVPVTAVDPALPVLEGGTLVRLGGYRRTDAGEWTPIALDAAEPERAMDARFGDSIVLDGVSAPHATLSAGDALPFTLHWRATAPVGRDYTAFAHLLNAAGETVAQLDWQPHDAVGRLPTSAWLVGQPVVDAQTLDLPADLAPGRYTLIGGLYFWQDGTRLPIIGADAQPGDVVTIATVNVE